MSDAPNPPLPDPGPGDGTHENDEWDLAANATGEPGSEQSDPDSAGTAETGSDGSLSPGSTATGAPTERD